MPTVPAEGKGKGHDDTPRVVILNQFTVTHFLDPEGVERLYVDPNLPEGESFNLITALGLLDWAARKVYELDDAED